MDLDGHVDPTDNRGVTKPKKARRPDTGLDFAQNAMRIVREATGESPRSTPLERRKKNRAARAQSKATRRKDR